MNQSVDHIASAIVHVSDTNQLMQNKISDISSMSGNVKASMKQATDYASELRDRTELLQGELANFRTGNTVFDNLSEETKRLRDSVQEILVDTKNNKNLNIFDQSYQLIPNSNPERYTTNYDKQVEDILTRLYDETVSRLDGCIYALAVDNKGYAPAHNSKFSQPPTGDPEKDILFSRNKRIFSDPVGIKLATNQEPFLFQSYLLDTGEIINDLSMPIFVEGKHWGAIRVGIESHKLL